ncbi:MAG: 30S ribosomal protein S17 [Deltaproteobacteria bacterium HGW-Deltaproteobacteria-19]|jgi:small subunit ribosomal protein S17|nr:MAG: 30S ribosomal protein S17 [Deltaproteobacteria bacterium HGW-Deltaproteobacteria-19]
MGERDNKRTIQGVVVSNKMDKTIVVRSERLVKHPVFQKYVRKYAQYMAQDEKNECGIGDRVLIVESRPLSRRKRWRMREVLEKAK